MWRLAETTCCIVLLVCPPVWAECAWVLWEYTKLTNYWITEGKTEETNTWSIPSAYPTSLDCYKVLKASWDFASERTKKCQAVKGCSNRIIKEVEPTLIVVSWEPTRDNPNSSVHTTKFMCLPDTVDPRK